MAETRIGIITTGILLLIAFFAGGCLENDTGINSKTGFLEASITIGPLCPVEPCEIQDAQKAEIYSARKIQIYTENRKNLVKELEEGTYIVDMNPLGIDRTAGLPAEIQVLSGETVYLNISIDTGIR